MHLLKTGFPVVALVLGMSCSAAASPFLFSAISIPGSALSFAQDVNNSGTIVGAFQPIPPVTPSRQGFLLNAGVLTPFSVPGFDRTTPTNINNLGQVVGYDRAVPGSGPPIQGFLKTGASYSPIDVPGATVTQPLGINDSGIIVGSYGPRGMTRGFVLSMGAFSPIDIFGAVSTSANDINNAGVIVGTYTDASGNDHGYRRNLDSSFTLIDVPGAIDTDIAGGINNLGDIVGYFDDAAGYHGFLLRAGAFQVFDFPGAANTYPAGLNDQDTIVGAFDVNGPPTAFMAVLVPEPATVLLLGAGFVGCLVRRRTVQQQG